MYPDMFTVGAPFLWRFVWLPPFVWCNCWLTARAGLSDGSSCWQLAHLILMSQRHGLSPRQPVEYPKSQTLVPLRPRLVGRPCSDFKDTTY